MPAVTRSTGWGKCATAANPITGQQFKEVTFAQHLKQTGIFEGRVAKHPNRCFVCNGNLKKS
jgi:uncharacterized protein with PIN domain